MAVTMVSQVFLPASRSTVWQKLNDPAVLRICIPGCQSMERTEEGGFIAIVKLKVGPVSATFKSNVQLKNLHEPVSYTLEGSGDGGMAGFASGRANVILADLEDGGCLLTYDVEVSVGGKMAQLGARMIEGVAKKITDQLFENFSQAVRSAGEPQTVPI